eukprot:497470_1
MSKTVCLTLRPMKMLPISVNRLVHTVPTNRSQSSKHNISLENSQQQKRLRGDSEIIARAHAPKDLNFDIRRKISKSNSSSKILSIIKSKSKKIKHSSVYGEAMKKCNELKDWKTTEFIMDMMLKSNIPFNVIEFNIFFNGMAKSDQPNKCLKYFKKMIYNYKITPDNITLPTLLKSCRWRGQYKLAEYYWNLIRHEYINVDTLKEAYTEMICVYSRAMQPAKATIIFKEYLQRVDNHEFQSNIAILGAYLNVFSNVADVNGMDTALELIKRRKIEINVVLISTMMNGYVKAKKPKLALDIWNRWMHEKSTPHEVCLALKCMALVQIIEIENKTANDFQIKLKAYNELQQTTEDLKKYGFQMNTIFAHCQLTAAIHLFYNVEPMQIVQVFDKLSKWVGYMTPRCKNTIDLHGYNLLEAQFLLRLVFGFRLKDILTTDAEMLTVIVGKGHHAKRSELKGNLRDFIMEELMKYEPSIGCMIDEDNSGRLLITKDQYLPYLKDEMNCAKHKLLHLSDDWFSPDNSLPIQINTNLLSKF